MLDYGYFLSLDRLSSVLYSVSAFHVNDSFLSLNSWIFIELD